MIPKRVRLQFQMLLNAAENHSLCITETTHRKTGTKAYVLCAHTNENLYPLAQLGAMPELHSPQHAGSKLI